MVNFIIIGHGKIAEGLLNANSMILGEQENVSVLSLDPNQSVDDFKKKLESEINNVKKGNEILILADLFGGTPVNVAVSVAYEREDIEIITGINLPLLIELINARYNNSLSELIDIWKNKKGMGMKLISEVIE